MNTVVLLFNKANMSGNDQGFLTNCQNNIFESFEIMGRLKPKFNPYIVHTPLHNFVPCLGNITDGDKVHVEATMQGLNKAPQETNNYLATDFGC